MIRVISEDVPMRVETCRSDGADKVGLMHMCISRFLCEIVILDKLQTESIGEKHVRVNEYLMWRSNI